MQAWRPLFSYCISLFLRAETRANCFQDVYQRTGFESRYSALRGSPASDDFWQMYIFISVTGIFFSLSAPGISCLWGLSAPNTPVPPEQPPPPWLLVPGLLHGPRAPSPVWGGWAEGRAGGCSPRCRAAPAEQPGRMAGGNCSGRDWWLQ